jgi:hypothetical protein
MSNNMGGVDVDVDVEGFNDMDIDNIENMDMNHMDTSRPPLQHQSNLDLFDKIDDIRSLNSVADLTTLISQSPSDYSYFNLDKLKLHDLPKHLKLVATRLLTEKKDDANPLSNINNQLRTTATARNKKEAPRIDLSIVCDRMKFFKVTKKAIYLCDRTIEKRSEKPSRIETERQYDYNARELFQPYFKTVPAKVFTDVDSVENLLIGDEIGAGAKHGLERQREQMANDDDDPHLGGIDDDFEIPCTAQTNDPFFSQHGGEFMQSQQVEGMMHNPGDMLMEQPPDDMRFDGNNLIEAPLQVNVLNIEYAKTSKNIDVRRLKQVIWSLLCEEQDKVTEIIFFMRRKRWDIFIYGWEELDY